MSQGNRGNLTGFVIAIVGGGATAFILGVLIWSFAVSFTRYEMEQERHTTHYADETNKQIKESCALADPMAVAKCVTNVVVAEHEQQRDERDLQAQREMANWAFWLLIVSLGSTGVTLAGIYYVRENLVAVREANAGALKGIEAANRSNSIAETAMTMDQRPWIRWNIEGPIEVTSVHETLGNAKILLKLRNIGKSPATGVSVHFKFWPDTSDFEKTMREISRFHENVCERFTEPNTRFSFLLPDEPQSVDRTIGFEMPFASLNQTGRGIIIAVSVTCESWFVEVPHHMGRGYWAMRNSILPWTTGETHSLDITEITDASAIT